MENILKEINKIVYENKQIEKVDLIIGLSKIVEMFDNKIDQLNNSKYIPLVEVGSEGICYTYSDGNLMDENEVELLRFDYLSGNYYFKFGTRNHEILTIHKDTFPKYHSGIKMVKEVVFK